jgi:hypothetical protein
VTEQGDGNYDFLPGVVMRCERERGHEGEHTDRTTLRGFSAAWTDDGPLQFERKSRKK